MTHLSRHLRNLAAIALFLAALPAAAEQTAHLIVKLKPAGKSASAPTLARVAEDSGVHLTPVRMLATGAELAALDSPMDLEAATKLARTLAANPAVDYAEPDRRVYPARFANDPSFLSQSYLADGPTSISAVTAWDVTTGSPGVVVAVIDTGVRPHVDLAGRLLPGYDMISSAEIANDGDGRDAGPHRSG